MRTILLCLVVAFLAWLWLRRSYTPLIYSDQIDHFTEDEIQEEEVDNTDFQSLVRFGEIRDAFLVQDASSDTQHQLQSIDERYNAAKRSTPEDKLSRGVYSSAEKRRLLEKLIHRPNRASNIRPKLWRHEFSDKIRGDIVPCGLSSAFSLFLLISQLF